MEAKLEKKKRKIDDDSLEAKKKIKLEEEQLLSNIKSIDKTKQLAGFNRSKKLAKSTCLEECALGQYYLGLCYENGCGVEIDAKEAIRLYGLSAYRGKNCKAQFRLAEHYYALAKHAEKMIEDKKAEEYLIKAMSLYKMSADQKWLPALVKLGKLYEEGEAILNEDEDLIVERDHKEAARLYQLAVEQGSAFGQSRLGYLYETGLGVVKNTQQAVELYRLAVKQDDASAQYYLASLYKSGSGVIKDIKEAVRLYRLSVQKQYIPAQYELAILYENGLDVAKDAKEAVRLYTLAAIAEEEPDHQFYDISCKAVFRLACISADQGTPEGLYKLGWCYEQAIGVGKKIDNALKIYRLSAEKGFANAQFRLGLLLDIPNTKRTRDIEESARLYQLAAKQGHDEARQRLTLIFMANEALERDWKQAFHFFRLQNEYPSIRSYAGDAEEVIAANTTITLQFPSL